MKDISGIRHLVGRRRAQRPRPAGAHGSACRW
jgi:hypothetical protein